MSDNNQQQNNHSKVIDHKDPFALKKIKKTSKGIFGFFITRYRVTLLVIISTILLGGMALTSIPREADPEVTIPIAIVTTVFPGASPADIENLVTEKIENKIEEIDNLKLVSSSSVLGISSITVEFEAEANLEDSIRDLKDKVGEITDLPEDATDPFVTEIRVSDTPIITFSLASTLQERELKKIGENIQDELEKISGISKVSLGGARNREFEVTVDRGELNRLNIPLTAVVRAIATSNADTPLGSITISQIDYNLRTTAKIISLDELKKIVVTNVGQEIILLEDIAKVNDVLAESKTISRLSVDGKVAVNTLSLQIYKRTGGNILNIVDTARQRIQDLQDDGSIPPEVLVEDSNDYSAFIRKDLKTLGTSGIISVVLIFIILFLALSIREAAISVLAIPMTFLITFFILNSFGFTLNSMVLFTLVLSLGLLVDTFIIILEGIFHNMRSGYTSTESALLSVAHYKTPLLAGTLTTVSAFVPMLLVSGIMGEYLRILPITISITLLSSLFVSLAIVPTVASIILKRHGKNNSYQEKESLLERLITNKLSKIYSEKIDLLLKSRKLKKRFLAIILFFFLVSLGLLAGGIIPVEMFPKSDVDFSLVDIEMPIGTDLELTDLKAQEVESYLYTRPDIKSFVTVVGGSSGFGMSGSSRSEHLASINVTFVDEKERDKKSYVINEEIREDLNNIVQGKITIREIGMGPPTGAPIEVRILGEEIKVIDELSEKLVNILENTEGVIDVESDKQVSPADLTFKLKKESLAQSGLTVGEVSGFLRAAIFGITATEVTIDEEDIDVIVKLNKENINSVEEIKNLSITNSFGQSIKISRVADFSLEPALATIRHRDFERTATVRANLETGYNATEAVEKVQKTLKGEIIPSGYMFDFGGEVEDIEQSFTELWNAMIVAVMLIVLILVLQFNSFKRPIIIMISLPLMLIGVVIGMLIFQLPFSFAVFIGLISLTGISVNDAIVLLDKAQRNIKEGKMKPRQAIADAGASRLQPILLTTLTTVAGILPLAFTDEFWFGLSISIIFGLAFATILQLFVIPMVFLKLEGKKTLKDVLAQE